MKTIKIFGIIDFGLKIFYFTKGFVIMFTKIKPSSCVKLLLGSAILAFGLYNIHSFSGVTEGGILGLTLLLQHHLGISPSVTGLVLSLICYGLGCFVLDRSFIIYSLIASVGYSVFYFIFEQIGPLFTHIADFPLVAAIIGAAFVGVGIGLCVRAGGAPGGDDALAMSLSYLTGRKLQSIYLVLDIIVLVLSVTYIPLGRLMCSLLSVVLSGQLIGFVADFKKTSTAV